MKKLLPVILAIITCIAFTSCGSGSIKGELASYSNADKSFSIDLPTSSDGFWVINDETPGNILDISDKKDTVNLRIQCLSKGQAASVAKDLEAYKDYSMVNTLGDVLADATLEENSTTSIPEFIEDVLVYEFDLSGDAKGKVLFMESGKCYYTYLIMAVNEAYDSNEKVFDESILSLKELTAVPDEKASEEENK